MIQINENRLIYDLLYTIGELYSTKNKNLIATNYDAYVVLNSALFDNFGTRIVRESRIKNLDSIIKRRDEKTIGKLVSSINTSYESLIKISDYYTNKMESIEFQFVPFYDTIKRYNEKDFKDLILGYFNTFGNDYYKIANSYFEENRVNIGSNIDNGRPFFHNIPCMKSGYIFIYSSKYNSLTASDLAHEMGHAIDSARFLIPQQKNIPTFSDMLLEVPSSVFELGFADYLKENHIDLEGSRILNNLFMMEANYYLGILKEAFKNQIFVVCADGYGYVVDPNEKDSLVRYNVREGIIYGIGEYLAMHLNELRTKDKKEFLERLNIAMTLRNELSLEQMIEALHYDYNDFVSGKYIDSTLDNKYLELRKRYKF